ncbi:MAG: type IV toxin-antitoxin system AbiEi family antitoxin domain-containing protein [Candidatus Omnitrophica bacterium]|nr:type IV toxin-antitoxin system AbiEi family antitoxin domain-containing protein [Candidatus Omnitrophota bacterium]
MPLKTLLKITRDHFTAHDVARAFGISPASAQVACSRYIEQGVLIRPKRGLYVLRHRWETLPEESVCEIANILETPSYISLTTALTLYNVTTQVQRNFYESISIKRTKDITIEGRVFQFRKIRKDLYGGFVKKERYFIATPEKALVDALYLTTLGRYRLDVAALDVAKFDAQKLNAWFKEYPLRVKRLWEQHGEISGNAVILRK